MKHYLARWQSLIRKACNNIPQEIIDTEITQAVTHAHHHQLSGGNYIDPLPQEPIRKENVFWHIYQGILLIRLFEPEGTRILATRCWSRATHILHPVLA